MGLIFNFNISITGENLKELLKCISFNPEISHRHDSTSKNEDWDFSDESFCEDFKKRLSSNLNSENIDINVDISARDDSHSAFDCWD